MCIRDSIKGEGGLSRISEYLNSASFRTDELNTYNRQKFGSYEEIKKQFTNIDFVILNKDVFEILSRLKPDIDLIDRVKEAVSKCRSSSIMKVTSDAGTNLKVNMKKTNTVGVWGWTDKPGTLAHWPGGLVVSFPNTSCVNGKLVFQTGDINLTFKKYFDTEVSFDIENDFIKKIYGKGADKKLIEKYFKSFNDKNSYATSHVGWGLNNKARYEALTMYDKSELNGTELRALSGCFLYSTCLLYTSPSPRDRTRSRMPSSA